MIFINNKTLKNMKKYILAILVLFAVTMSSCTSAEAVVYDEPSVDYIITYGTPYYYNGVVIYYYYNGYMYYPSHHRVYYHHRRGWVNPGTQRPIKPHRGGKPNPSHGGHGGHGGHGNSHHNGGHIGNGSHGNGHGGSHGHGGSGGRPSPSRRR